ncbi:MAG TPA: vitamin K epoxide reductase family protein [Gemmatimonadaceae bacterium]|jgi:uncharacterized membrane protein|nr:vitamin K epoxide reductase family protein [Gemmatimonadaceae bacterium]
MLIAALALIGVFVALYLTLYKLGVIGHLACTVGGCEQVNTSRWATFFGAPVATWGLAFYVVAFVIALIGTTPSQAANRTISVLLTVMSMGGFLFSAWLTSLELFVIHAICQYCVVSAVIVTLIFVISVADLREVLGTR